MYLQEYCFATCKTPFTYFWCCILHLQDDFQSPLGALIKAATEPTLDDPDWGR